MTLDIALRRAPKTEPPWPRIRAWWSQRALITKAITVVAVPLVPALAALATMVVIDARSEALDQRQQATIAIEGQANSLLKTLLDAETGVRGYLLTENDEFLQPYNDALQRVRPQTAELQEMLLAAEGKELARIDELITTRFEILGDLIANERSSTDAGDERAMNRLLRRGKDTMDRLRDVIGRVVANENRLQAAAVRAQENARRLQMTMAALGVVLGLLAGIASILLFASSVVRRVVLAAENATRLANRQPLLPLPPGGGELAILARSLEEASERLAEEEDRRKRAEEGLLRANEDLERRVKKRTADLEDARLEILQRLALAAEFRDDDTAEHTQRVAETCAAIAANLGLPDETIEVLKLAAPLHDVGKIGISDTILLKPGKFTDEEFAAMRAHTTIGAAILSGSRSEVLCMGEAIALNHHERWDGAGYPNGKTGEDIPLEARIVSVADVFDALTNERPYKKAWPIEDALRQIEGLAGRSFDPQVVAAFLAVVRGKATKVPADDQQSAG